ncbi:IclR family transcriptional regulator [Cryobacterium tepidiphilum]|uniref:IclR family transcriptional regulator n=1 Tax=Cryobacterium tepidiphilum TaxID=2486026 RepID=A0A3M8LGV9_9MICO|nr:IclR family transcriptional regulator [Cryobacterium tepidiphilum]RNE63962.1 IclR family transcriptional regulator [Cryobacterium tepidiphilum]
MQVVIRSLNVLRLLARTSRGLSLGEIAERLELPGASAHRLLAVLEGEGFVTRSSVNRRYFLGPASRELAEAAQPRQSPLVTAHRAIADASRESGETVFLCELTHGRAVCSALTESPHPLRLFVRVGQDMPLHAAASARVLLAWRDQGEVRRMLGEQPLRTFTSKTPASTDEVLDHLRIVRSRGFDICESELDEDVWAVSAPVRTSTDQVVASVTLAAPAQRLHSEKNRTAAVAVIRSAAAAMSADLGWAGAAAVS